MAIKKFNVGETVFVNYKTIFGIKVQIETIVRETKTLLITDKNRIRKNRILWGNIELTRLDNEASKALYNHASNGKFIIIC